MEEDRSNNFKNKYQFNELDSFLDYINSQYQESKNQLYTEKENPKFNFSMHSSEFKSL